MQTHTTLTHVVRTAVVSAAFFGALGGAYLAADALAMPIQVVKFTPLTVETEPVHGLTEGIARRLSKRLSRTHGVAPGMASVRTAVEKRQRLLARTMTVNVPIIGTVMTGALAWNVQTAEHPLWIDPQISDKDIAFAINTDRVTHDLSAGLPMGLPQVVDANAVVGNVDAYDVLRATATEQASSGYEWADANAVTAIAKAFEKGYKTWEQPLRYRDATVTLIDGQTVTTLSLLSSGKSDFKSSPWGRKANIRKAVDEKLQGVVIPKAQDFAFNDTLGGPVTKSRGWFDSLIIVNGSALEPAPGGGICQAATTIYRSAMLAGLPILKRAPHSLYVHYYKAYGLGLDATIFPGRQDFSFRNDTPGPIFVQAAMTGETEVTVQLYGIADGRSVALEGPYFSGSHDGFARPIRGNEIGWKRIITLADGRTQQESVISAYGKMPASLRNNVASIDMPDAVAFTHAAAPNEQAALLE